MKAMGSVLKIFPMIYAVISFIPWVLYFILCGMGNQWGVVIPFVLSLFLLPFRIYKKHIGFMDLTSVFYFTVGMLGTFPLNVDIFVKNGGFLGYLALSLMAIFSLAARQPFTLQVAKRHYPRELWNSKTFLRVSDVITSVWIGIFLTNMIIFLLFGKLAVIPSNILIVLGIVFSMIFPRKRIAFAARKGSVYG